MHALEGGPDGLKVVRLVLQLAIKYLKPKGILWLELGNDHPPLVKTLVNITMQKHLKCLQIYKDDIKRERFMEIERL